MGSKVTVVGAGFYGSTTAMRLAEYNIFDSVVGKIACSNKSDGPRNQHQRLTLWRNNMAICCRGKATETCQRHALEGES